MDGFDGETLKQAATDTPLPQVETLANSQANAQSAALVEIPISLSKVANIPVRNLFPNFEFGQLEYQGVRFEVPTNLHVVTTQCSSPDPARPQTVLIDIAPIEKPVTVFLLINAAARIPLTGARLLEALNLPSRMEPLATTDLVVGQNVREWRIDAAYTISTTVDPLTQEAAREISNRGDTGVIDMLAIELPPAFRERTLTSIQILDNSTDIQGSLNPCLQILGATVRACSEAGEWRNICCSRAQ